MLHKLVIASTRPYMGADGWVGENGPKDEKRKPVAPSYLSEFEKKLQLKFSLVLPPCTVFPCTFPCGEIASRKRRER